MNRRRLEHSVLPFLMAAACNLSAQNARTEALGGNFIIDDISLISGAPASGNYLGDVIQASAYSDTLAGSVYAVKSLGGWATIGMIANNESELLSNFYDDARSSLGSTLSLIDTLPEEIGTFPHLVLGTEVAGVGLGCDLYFERSAGSQTWTSETGKQEFHKSEIRNAGVSFSAVVEFWKIGLYPYGWINFASAKGTSLLNDTASEVQAVIPADPLFGAGIESGIELGKYYFRFGGYLAKEQYRLSTARAGVASADDHVMNSLGLYGGCIVYPVDALLLSAAYTYERSNTNDIFSDIATSSSVNDVYAESSHFIVGSFEYKYVTRKIVDFVAIRGGLNWSFSRSTFSEAINSSGVLYPAFIKYPDEVSSVKPSFGFGAGKNGIHFDIASSPGGWNGLFSGPPVILGTVTLHLDEMKKGQ